MTELADVLTELRGLAPEFDAVTDGVVFAHIAMALRMTDDDADILLVALLTAHLLELRARASGGASASGRAGNGATIASVSSGDESISFAVAAPASQSEAWYTSTPYGKKYLALLESLTAGGGYFGGHEEASSFRKGGGRW